MTTLVNTNKLTWFQNDGEPLKSGYIYVGDPNQDPRSFPKTVTFTDSDGNAFTAAQPLRTDENGRIQWNGVAIQATVDGDYSLLILNSNQTQIEDGYISSVTDRFAGGTTGTDDYREYALTLADVKKLDKSPGQTVGNIGKVSAADDDGANWLVVSNTGNPADDIDLIDFDNGLQGERIKNFTKEAATAQDKQDVRDNIGVYSKAEVDSGFQAVVADTSGYTQTTTRHIRNTIPSAVVVASSFPITVGPTGSGAGYIWSDLDDVPTDATSIIAVVGGDVLGSSGATTVAVAGTFGGVRAVDSRMISTSADLTSIRATAQADIPVDGSNVFTVDIAAIAGGTVNQSMLLQLVGFNR